MLRIIHPHILIRDKLRDRPHYSWKEAGRRASWSDLRHTGRKIGDIVCPDQDHREAFPLITPQLSAAPPPDNVFVQTLIIYWFFLLLNWKTWKNLVSITNSHLNINDIAKQKLLRNPFRSNRHRADGDNDVSCLPWQIIKVAELV